MLLVFLCLKFKILNNSFRINVEHWGEHSIFQLLVFMKEYYCIFNFMYKKRLKLKRKVIVMKRAKTTIIGGERKKKGAPVF